MKKNRKMRENNRDDLTATLLALIVAIAIVILGNAAFGAEKYGTYVVASAIAVDGDTIKGDVLIWPGFTANTSIRVLGIDTPEIKGPTACEREKAQAARAFTDAWLSANHPVSIDSVSLDKFAGRVDANVRGANGNMLAGALLAAGHARPYTGGTRGPWCQ